MSKIEALKNATPRSLSGGQDVLIVEEQMSTDQWVAAGRPLCWLLVETLGDITCYVDVGWGGIALFNKDRLMSMGIKEVITDEGVAAFDIGYYGTKKYIWTQEV